jgi:hypothetical protein
MFTNLWRYVRGPATRRGPQRPRRFRPLAETLEDRLTPATITVMGTGDDGGIFTPTGPGTFTDTTLRGAITSANAMPGQDLINFAIGGPAGVKTIKLGLALPTITESVVILGPDPGDPTMSPQIVVSGLSTPAGANGLTITADHSTVQNLSFLGFMDGSGILLTGPGATDNVVAGCWFGPNADGLSATENLNGLTITGGASNNTVGGILGKDRNVLSGNHDNGLLLAGAGTTGNQVLNNVLGLRPDGTFELHNGLNGVNITGGASGNRVGDIADGGGNVIAGNPGAGVQIAGAGTSGNVVVNNLIGLNAAEKPFANGSGVLITDGADGNTVGGTDFNAGNVLCGNAGSGVAIEGASGNTVAGNLIGTDPSGAPALGNASGVQLFGGASGNIIGGTDPFAQNVISGNLSGGVLIDDGGTSGNVVAGNLIGTAPGGGSALPNGSAAVPADGVFIFNGATGNTVGGPDSSSRNVIAGNTSGGVRIQDVGTSGNLVAGNFIGTDLSGAIAVANVVGVIIANGASGNLIGGTAPGDRNVIAGNADKGVQIMDPGTMGNTVAGNYIGTNAAGTVGLHTGIVGIVLFNGATDNTVGGTAAGARNLISGNGGPGIQIAGAGTSGNTVAGNFIGTDPTGTAAVPNAASGVLLDAGAGGNTVGGTATAARNLISGNGGDGLVIADAGTSGNVVAGNYIGTNAAGTAALGNGTTAAFANGVLLTGGAGGNLIGGTAAGAGNVISGNPGAGVGIEGAGTTGNTVAGNHLGTNAAGTAALGNGFRGVAIAGGASGNLIGGTTAGAGNLISGNGFNGVLITGAGTTGNTVAGNDIGTDVTGTIALGNHFGGVNLDSGASGNTIGGTVAAARNVISGNGALANGVVISAAGTMGNTVAGNFIGTLADGVTALGNGGDGVLIAAGAGPNTVGGTGPASGNVIANNSKGVVLTGSGGLGTPPSAGNRLLSNRIFANAGPGIDLGDDGATANDPGDGDTGPNNLQNSPVLTSAAGTTVTGTLNSAPGTSFRIEFFASPAGGPAGQGQTFLGFTDVTTDAAGNAGFSATVAAVPAGQVVTATAINSTTGDTSEFSPSVTATVPGPAATPAVTPPSAPAAATSPAVGGVAALTDVTGQVHLVGRRVQVFGASGLMRVRLLLRNSGTTLTGPVSFVLDRLTRGVKVASRDGMTTRFAPLRSPFQEVPLGPHNRVRVGPVEAPPPFAGTQFGGVNGFFAPGEVRELVLMLRNPAGGGIRFSFRVLAGPGVR